MMVSDLEEIINEAAGGGTTSGNSASGSAGVAADIVTSGASPENLSNNRDVQSTGEKKKPHKVAGHTHHPVLRPIASVERMDGLVNYVTSASSAGHSDISSPPIATPPVMPNRPDMMDDSHTAPCYLRGCGCGVEPERTVYSENRDTVDGVGISLEGLEEMGALPGVRNTESYSSIKARLLRNKQLWEDPDFKASYSSLTYSGRDVRGIRWKRPQEIIRGPVFIKHGATRHDLDQGSLGDCWLVAAAATLALHPKLFARVVPEDQGFDKEYCGMFRFNMWIHGQWEEVLVDDRLPTLNGRLYYMSNRENSNEFWSALLEKAYAKVNGSYEAIDGGRSFEALVDFTGGISETIDLKKLDMPDSTLFDIVQKTFSMNSLQCGGIWQSKGFTRETQLENGIYTGHAYSITGIAKVGLSGGKKEELLRLRNPWGRGEWKGRWSDGSREWQALTEADRKRLLYRPMEDGEFWMPFHEFVRNFNSLEISHLTPDSLTAEIARDMEKKQWLETTHHAEWTRHVNAGGCGNYPNNDLYWINPQFHVNLSVPDEERSDGKATMVVSLTQKHRRYLQNVHKKDKTFVAIGLSIYKLKRNQRVRLDGRNYEKNALLHRRTIDIYSPKREVCMRLRLELGDYIVIPSTFDAHLESEFMLRCFTVVPATTTEMEERTVVVVDPEEKQLQLLKALFNKMKGEDNKVDYRELRDMMNVLFKKDVTEGFSRDGARQILSSFDDDKSGFLTFTEFHKIVTRCINFRGLMQQYDKDGNKKVNVWELKKIFEDMGIKLSYKALRSIVRWYGGRDGMMAFEDFVVCVFRLFGASKTFERNTTADDPTHVNMNMDTWLASSFSF